MGSLLRTLREGEYLACTRSHHDDLRGFPATSRLLFSLKHHGVVHITHGLGQGADKQQQQHNQPWIRNSWDKGVSLRPSPQTTLTLKTLPPSTTTGWRWRWTLPTSPPCPSSKSWKRWRRSSRRRSPPPAPPPTP